MKRRPTKSPVVKTFADHTVLVPENVLDDAIALAGNPNAVADLIAKAETALEQLSSNFPYWMQSECDRLMRMWRAAQAQGLAGPARQNLFSAAHDLRGHAATLGFPMAAAAAESLCRLLEHTPQPHQIPLALVDQHVDGIRAIAREGSASPADRIAQQLCERLREVTDAFLTQINAHRPEYLEGLVAPSRGSVT